MNSWDSADDSNRRFPIWETKGWLMAARVLLPLNAFLLGWIIGQAF